MDKGQFCYDIKVIRKGYREIGRDPVFCLTLFVLIILFTASLFLILIHEPVADWHETTFSVDRMELRNTGRNGYVLNVYAVDGRRFVLNENEKEILGQLEIGGTYSAVYSEDFFHNIIQGLFDEDTVYLNLESRQNAGVISFWVLYITLSVSGGLLLFLNGFFAMRCVKRERKRMKRFQKSKKR